MAYFVITITFGNTPEITTFEHELTSNLAFDQSSTFQQWTWGEAANIASSNENLDCCSSIKIDQQTHKVTVQTDRFGLFPVLVFKTADRLILTNHASRFKDTYPELCTLDPVGVGQMLTIEQCLGEQTLLQGLTHLAPSTQFTWDSNLQMARDVTPVRKRATKRSSKQDAIDSFVEAVDRRLKAQPDTLIPLSGGLDTRLILSAAIAAGHKPETFCYGRKNSADFMIAQQLADTAGLNHRAFIANPAELSNSIDRIAYVGGGEIPIRHGHGFIASEALESTKGRPIMTGTGGELYRAFYLNRGAPGMGLFAFSSLKPKLEPRAIRYVNEHYGNACRSFAGAYPEISEAAFSSLNWEIDRLTSQSRSAAQLTEHVYLTMRMRRFILSGQRALDFYYDRAHPFLDAQVVDTWSNLSIRKKLRSNMHRIAIAKLTPQLNEITWDQTMAPMSRGLSFKESYPGIFTRLGLTADYAKKGTVMYDYNELPTLSSDIIQQCLPDYNGKGLDDLPSRSVLHAVSRFMGIASKAETKAA